MRHCRSLFRNGRARPLPLVGGRLLRADCQLGESAEQTDTKLLGTDSVPPADEKTPDGDHELPERGCSVEEGDRYFFYRNNGLQNQSVLYYKNSLEGEPVELLDPNKLSSDGTVALSTLGISDDGTTSATPSRATAATGRRFSSRTSPPARCWPTTSCG